MTAEEFLKERGWTPADPKVFPLAKDGDYWKNPTRRGEPYLRQDLAVKFILERPPFEII